ncbi:MAG TPA: hypothetical protein VN428_02620 [Bryobacteraceae bacterium]|nr:hypothetical protein [Bryobacteraceae bacterium]
MVAPIAALMLSLISPADPSEVPQVTMSGQQVKALLGSLPRDAAGSNKLLADRKNYRLSVARVADRDGPAEVHESVADIFVVLRGSGKLMLGGELVGGREVRPGERQAPRASGAKEIELKVGTIVEVPSKVAHQILAKGTEVCYLVIKIQ